jgi:hypothetical protein
MMLTSSRARLAPILSSLAGVLLLASSASADLLLGNYGGGSGPPRTIRRYREDGSFVLLYDPPTESTQGIAVGANGNVYAMGNFLGAGVLYQFQASTGALLGNPSATPPYNSPGGLTFVNGFAYTTDFGFLGPAMGVLRIDPVSGASAGVAVAPNTNALTTPSKVFVTPAGDLLVTDGLRLNQYDKTSLAFLGTLLTAGVGNGLSSINDVTYGNDGNLYIASIGSNRLERFNGTTGAFIDAFVPSTMLPRAISFGDDGNLYVLRGTIGAQVDRFNGTTGAFINTFLPPDAVNYPTATYLRFAPDVPEPTTALAGALGCAVLARRPRHLRHT